VIFFFFRLTAAAAKVAVKQLHGMRRFIHLSVSSVGMNIAGMMAHLKHVVKP
jgi:hypothetical protein